MILKPERHQNLVLASASPRRRELLDRAGARFRVVAPRGVDESEPCGVARDRCVELAEAKARAGRDQASASDPGAWTLGCDTLVVADVESGEHILGKPVSRDDARRGLQLLSGRAHRVVSGLAVIDPDGEIDARSETSDVSFRKLSAADIEAYLDTGDWAGKAGGYGIQSEGAGLVAEFRGCYYNIVGLPMSLLAAMLPRDVEFEWVCDCGRHPLYAGGGACGGAD